ncbi:MAG: DUF4235 domain-containing protein [Actinomycetota bacterium]
MAEEGKTKQKSSIFQTLLAMIAGVIAVKVATYLVTTVWRLATREEPPQADERVHPAKKAAWIALVGAATGAARQTARDFVKPAPEGDD